MEDSPSIQKLRLFWPRPVATRRPKFQVRGNEIAIPAKVKDLIDALDMQGDRAASYLDLDTGEVHVIAHEVFAIAEEGMGAHSLDWEKEEVALAQRICAGDRYVELPTSLDVHEWRIMEAFSSSLADDDSQADCLRAIRGRGAFRAFRNELSRHGLWDAWHAFRNAALRKIAIAWCEEHGIAFQA